MTVLNRLSEDLQKVFKTYEGMDKEYVKIIRKHHGVATNPDLTEQAKNKDRAATVEAVQELKRKYFERAKAEIDKLREAYRPKVEIPKLSSAERLLNVTLWTQTLPTATAAELRELYLEHKGNEDFMQLLEAQFRQRKDDLGLQQLKHEIAHEPEDRALARLQKAEDALSFLTNRELAVVLNELQRQVALEQYNDQYSHWAFLAAVITNGFGAIAGMFSKRKHKAVSPDDFMGKDAKKMLQRLLGQEPEQKDWSRHIEDARAKGLVGPW